jgi:SAM-dependent methyltransferase
MNRLMPILVALILRPLVAEAEVYQITAHNGEAVVLRFDAPANTIERSPGRRHSWGRCGCYMCLHNHLVGTHAQGADYLRRSGWGSWTTIHDNLHNDPSFKGESGTRRYVGSSLGAAPKEPSAFAPTPLDVCEAMLDLTVIGSEDVVYDLGCGDGRLLVMAAVKYNCRAIGLDVDPACVKQANKNIERYGVEHLARAYERDALETDIGDASVVTLYLMPTLGERLRPQLRALPPGSRVVAHDKPIPDWTPDARIPVTSSADERKHSLYLWRTVAEKEQRGKPRCKT